MPRVTIGILLTLAITGCSDGPVSPRDRPLSGSTGTAQWRAGSRIVIQDSLVVTKQLTIEPGTVVCGLPEARLVIGSGATLFAVGTVAQPITFTACDPTKGWAGIRVGGVHYSEGGATAELAHVIIEFASNGIYTGGASTVEIDSSRFRRAGISSAVSRSTTHLRNSIVDTADVIISNGTFQNTLIRAGRLILRPDRSESRVTIDGGRIEDSPETALSLINWPHGGFPQVTALRPLRIVGSRGTAVSIPVYIFTAIWPTREAQDSLLGNANDTLEVWTGTTSRHVYIRADLPWSVPMSCCGLPFPLWADSLTIEPGATVLVGVGIQARGPVRAEGTAERPIKVISYGHATENFYFNFNDTAQSHLKHMVFSNVAIGTAQQHSVILDHIVTNAPISFAAPGSRLLHSRVRNIARATEAIRIYANDIQLSNCEVSDNAGDGVWIFQGNAQFPYSARDVHINECNIERNGGFGINNRNPSMVDARRNWWGDPAGPLGPGGDGVSGNVDYSEHRTTPIPPLVFRIR